MANPCESCTFNTFLGCSISGVRSGVETLVTREDERGAPDDARNRRLLQLCETLEGMCEVYRTDVESYALAERLRSSMGEISTSA